jgi:hypothetical protein
LNPGSIGPPTKLRSRICNRPEAAEANMKNSRLVFVPAFFIASALIAQDAEVTALTSKDLPDFQSRKL